MCVVVGIAIVWIAVWIGIFLAKKVVANVFAGYPIFALCTGSLYTGVILLIYFFFQNS